MMSCKRISRARLGTAPLCLLLFSLGGAAGCTTYQTFKVVPVDCTADDGYAIKSFNAFETVGDTPFWTAGDKTPDAGTTDTVQTIPDGPRCGSKAAVVLRTSGNNDWGSIFGLNVFNPGDVSMYEGLSFWARAPGNTTKGFTLSLDDPNTANISGSNCKFYGSAGGTGAPGGTAIDPNTGQTLSSGTVTRAIYPDECGNSYTTVVLATSEWEFYTVPFSAFHQTATPNRVPNAVLTEAGNVPGTGLLTNKLLTFILRWPKQATAELWLDDLGFYRRQMDAGQ